MDFDLPGRGGATLRTRLWKRVHVTPNGCWEWRGGVDSSGYGQVAATSVGGRPKRTLRVHRVVYTLLGGSIPEGLELDHLCRNRRCCFPGHLEPVTTRENQERGENPKYVARRNGTCIRGHDDIGHRTTDGRAYCRECARKGGQ